MVPPDAIGIVHVLLTEYCSHMILFRQDDPMMDCHDTCPKYQDERIQRVEDGRDDSGIHPQIHRVPAESEQAADLEAGALPRRSKAKRAAEFEPSEKEECESEHPERQGDPGDDGRRFDNGQADAPLRSTIAPQTTRIEYLLM